MFTALVIIVGMCEIAEHRMGITDKIVCVCVFANVKDKGDTQLGKAFRFKGKNRMD